jgi:hypothetical protein
MTQARLIVGKDLRRLRWMLIAWLALIGARTLVATAGADVALGGFGPQIAVSEISALLSLIYVLLLAFLVSRLVHDEPLVGRDAFWITRPIAPGALLSAKLAVAALFFVVVPVAGDVVAAAAFGTRVGALASTIVVSAVNRLVVVLLLVAIAALTPSLTRFTLAILGLVAALVALMVSATLTALFVTEEVAEGGDIPFPDPTPPLVAAAIVVFAALAVIFYQYRTRRLRRALAIAAVGAVLVWIVPERWPWSFAARPRAEAVAPPQDAAAVAIALDAGRPRITDAFTLRRRAAPKKQVSARARVAGVPREFNVRAVAARSRLELPGGAVLQSGANRFAATLGSGGGWPGAAAALESALGGVRLLTAGTRDNAAAAEQWPLLLTVDDRDFARHRRERGRLTADLSIMLDRPVVRGVLPLADGAVHDTGPFRVAVVRVIRRATGCTVLLRRSHVEPLVSLPRYAFFTYVLRNGARREAAAGEVHELSQDGFSAGAFFLPTPRIGGRGFVLEQFEIEFPARSRPDDPPVDLEAGWIDGAELVVLETVSAGAIDRTVTVEEFQITP